jgi:GNAT superfamily N-acetyltransferase
MPSAMTMDYGHKSLPSTFSTIRHVGVRRALSTAATRSWGVNRFFGLAADLSRLPEGIGSTSSVVMEPVESVSYDGFDDALENEPREEVPELLARARLCHGAVTTLYVARSEDGDLYAQWLVSAPEQELAGTLLGATRRLGERESLVEGAYTFPAARGRGAMRDGMGQLLLIARDRGDERVLTYVHESNVPSLRGCAAVGFRVDHIRIETWRLGYMQRQFEPLTDDHRRQWSTLTAPR